MRKQGVACIVALLVISLSACAGSTAGPSNAQPDNSIPAPAEALLQEEQEETEEIEAELPLPSFVNAVELSSPEELKYAPIIYAYRDFALNFHSYDVDNLVNHAYETLCNELGLDDDWKRNALWSSVIDARHGDLGYALCDLNNDGILNLIILSERHVNDYSVCGIYSLDNDAPILTEAFWSRYSCYIDENGTLYIHGSGGASDNSSASYVILPGGAELQMIEEIGMESYRDEEADKWVRCYRIKDGVKTNIDCEEALAEREQRFYYSGSFSVNDAGLVFNPMLKLK